FTCVFLISWGLVGQRTDEIGRKISAEEYQEDLTVLWNHLSHSHSGLNRYAQESHLEEILDGAKDIHDSVPLHQALFEMGSLVQQIRDGHTYLQLSSEQEAFLLETQKFLPFTIKILDNQAFIHQNYSSWDISTGAKIISIDGKPIQQVLELLRKYMTTDGFSVSARNQLLDGQFWWYYSVHFGFKNQHHVVVMDEQQRKSKFIESIFYEERVLQMMDWTLSEQDDYPIHWYIDKGVGHFEISRFHGISLKEYKATLDEAFEQFVTQDCEYLILDIRGNGGGREGFENILFSHFQHTLDRKYDRVYMRNINSANYKEVEQGGLKRMSDWLYRTVEFKGSCDFWDRRERFGSSWDKPKHVFKGTCYVLIDGEVFSGAADFSAMVSDYGTDMFLVGEETAGGYQGNTSGYFYQLTLPNTGFKVQIPRINFDLNVRNNLHMGGVKPNFEVPTTIEDFVQNVDTQLEFVYQLISTELLGDD
ncbi:MAG: hypothetical protein HRT74_10820, partial [Flavobacteriales bacterium]|nr:hypothetical protein [Flavobacteriales bacterium]